MWDPSSLYWSILAWSIVTSGSAGMNDISSHLDEDYLSVGPRQGGGGWGGGGWGGGGGITLRSYV